MNISMKLILAIGAGSFIGGIFRYLLSILVQTKTTTNFPLGTLTVNIIGCFFIGIVFGIFDKGQMSHEWKLFLATGIIGGFTTFSAFSMETFSLFREGHTGYALLYILASVLLGLLATYIAYLLVK
jgi:CrcB protein